ncbi:FkbM family methyltransferase [Moorena producens]|uniref:FkbM family methyltransferase n=1 Tax=Moorena producens TaxID=1155739 RepID=UPI003C738065
MKSITKTAINIFPGKSIILKWGALCPVLLRNYLSYRFFHAIARRVPKTINLLTNMGISHSCLYKIPSNYNHVAIFGKPEYYLGERGALKLSECLTQYSDAFVDIGAHIGYFTFYVREKMALDKPIFFFEPDPNLFNLIDKNVNLNELKNVHGFQAAISSKSGSIKFYKNLSDSSSGSITQDFYSKHEVQEITVQSTTFSNFLNKYSLNNVCVKVDVEGAESDFIKGAMTSLNDISYLIVEVLGPAINNNFIQNMIELGYFAYYINDYCLEHSIDGSFNYVAPQYNWLFCHDHPSQLSEKLEKTKFKIKSNSK